MSSMRDVFDNCISCDEDDDGEKCPKSLKPCGHHCNHLWTHDECCFCGAKAGEVDGS